MTEEPREHRRPKRDRASLAELTLLVRVPSQPGAIRAFTNAERDAAEHYASRFDDAMIEPLP
ncbi:hypothetical protein H7I77_09695 [Mycolicibacterium novocastrense]|uniref:Uncharacterized protein n=1 Tax=Mycolicibacterium novocastrense TaxID=59813 RepID=A0AAW5SK66_MYCNV|nr:MULTISPECIES: hypothetical protein [Mycolicibacterium]MCV7023619.1 hypothetical protein [Mycolicibacterium novocastrense]MDX1886819.1 hypothetical protein [Mycolicibacterium sp. 120270]GAT07739.1 uncharacterized protein RMCN_0872 [Mycolicibacterium novocastrense]